VTYSAVLRDAATGAIGVACQSHFFAVGAVVPWAQAGVGAVATQAVPDAGYGPRGLAAMHAGASAAEALRSLVGKDPAAELRQVAMVDSGGRVAVHTGDRCIAAAGSRTGDGWSVQGNFLTGDDVLDAMGAALADAADGAGDVGDRLLAALAAADAAGGDIRGRQAAALVVVDGRRDDEPWNGVLVDLRVDDSSDPVGDLGRLLRTKRAVDRVMAAVATPGLVIGSPADATVDVDEVLAGLAGAAAELGSDNPEAPLWRAVILTRAGRRDEARRAWAELETIRPPLRELIPRLTDIGVLTEGALQ
jgi:uncharacterized Ntn-hydrolase superfamily protein